jgi:hypothetical protein
MVPLCPTAASHRLKWGKNDVQSRPVLAALILTLAAGVSSWAPARAGTLYSSAGFIQGSQSFVQSFEITTPGTLTVTLSTIPWMDTISDLNLFLTTSSGVIGNSMGVGTESVTVAPGVVYAHWFGDADGNYGIGVYGLDVTFKPSTPTPVPVPTSIVLFLSGLGLLWGGRRYRLSMPMPAWRLATR